MQNKTKEIELGYEKANSMHQSELHKQMLGEPVWVVRPPNKTKSLPWKGTVTKVVNDSTFLVKRFGRNEEEEVDMYDVRSVKKKKKN